MIDFCARYRTTQRIVLLAALLLWSLPAHATSWPVPRRPLSTDEQMEMAVSQAQHVLIGTALASGDSLDDAGLLWRWVDVMPQRWLKGPKTQALVRVFFSQTSDRGWSQVAAWKPEFPVRCLVFLRNASGQQGSYLAVTEHPEFPGCGIVRLAKQIDVQEQRATLALSSLSS